MFKSLLLSLICIMMVTVMSAQDKLSSSIERGQDIYNGYCMVCHMDQGQGIEGAFPPLAQSDYLMADVKRSIRTVKFGLEGEIEVNGKKYNNIMTPLGLSDEEIADVLNFVRNSWGNQGDYISPSDVKKVK